MDSHDTSSVVSIVRVVGIIIVDMSKWLQIFVSVNKMSNVFTSKLSDLHKQSKAIQLT